MSIKKREGYFTGWNGIELYYQSWMPKHPKLILGVIHGLGEHCGRYKHFAQYFSDKGYGLYLYDQRGHGKSPGKRVHAMHLKEFVDDLQSFLKMIRREEEETKFFLLGHSFGGQIAINYLGNHSVGLSGAILSAPNIQLAMPVHPLKKLMADTLSLILPTMSLGNDIHAEYLSHDLQIVRDYQSDKLVNHRITLRMGAEVLENLNQLMALAPKIKTPSLVLHGSADKITSPQGSREFFDRMKVADRQYKLYPDYYHEIFNEIGKEKVFQDIEAWLQKRV
jgi:acylglycerol lipase